jgi:hypothetical protein
VDFKAKSEFRPADLVALQASIVPRIVAAVTAGCGAAVAEARLIALPHVQTGDYLASIHVGAVELIGHVVQGAVVADSAHAAYVEYGTGERGAASARPGPGPYAPGWPGMTAQAPLRTGVDLARPAIVEAFAKQGFNV